MGNCWFTTRAYAHKEIQSGITEVDAELERQRTVLKGLEQQLLCVKNECSNKKPTAQQKAHLLDLLKQKRSCNTIIQKHTRRRGAYQKTVSTLSEYDQNQTFVKRIHKVDGIVKSLKVNPTKVEKTLQEASDTMDTVANFNDTVGHAMTDYEDDLALEPWDQPSVTDAALEAELEQELDEMFSADTTATDTSDSTNHSLLPLAASQTTAATTATTHTHTNGSNGNNNNNKQKTTEEKQRLLIGGVSINMS